MVPVSWNAIVYQEYRMPTFGERHVWGTRAPKTCGSRCRGPNENRVSGTVRLPMDFDSRMMQVFPYYFDYVRCCDPGRCARCVTCRRCPYGTGMIAAIF
jgi:hypothetical protein